MIKQTTTAASIEERLTMKNTTFVKNPNWKKNYNQINTVDTLLHDLSDYWNASKTEQAKREYLLIVFQQLQQIWDDSDEAIREYIVELVDDFNKFYF